MIQYRAIWVVNIVAPDIEKAAAMVRQLHKDENSPAKGYMIFDEFGGVTIAEFGDNNSVVTKH